MLRMTKNVRLAVVVIAIWTIVQTCFHAFWVIYCYLVTICKIKPTYSDVVFVYLTYFYRNSCGVIDLKNEAYFLNSTTSGGSERVSSDALYHFLKETLEKGLLPQQSNAASRTDLYLYLFMYTDVTWVVSSVFLFVGAFFETKQKFMSVLFYGPWMLVCAFVSFLDVVASVQFGLDITYTHSYTDWLKFIGVSNYDDFKPFNSHQSSKLIPALPSTIIVCLLSRVFLVWLINVVCFFIILFMAIPDIFFKDIVRPKSRKSGNRKLKLDSGEELDLNSSEARIRNWQLFYGAIEANSTMASTSSNSSGSSSSTDHNSNSRQKEDDNKIHKKQLETNYEKTTQNRELATISTDSGFRRYSDVAHGISTLPTISASNLKVEVLRGQLPWSYISPQGQYIKKNHTYTKKTMPKTAQIRDSVTDSTRL